MLDVVGATEPTKQKSLDRGSQRGNVLILVVLRPPPTSGM